MPIYPYQGRWPSLGARVFLAPGAYLTGDMTLGEDVSFWFHTAARGDVNFIRIGARTNIQDGTVLARLLSHASAGDRRGCGGWGIRPCSMAAPSRMAP